MPFTCRLPAGWLIPIAILFIISFPPVSPPINVVLTPRNTDQFRSSLATKLSLFFVVSFGDCGPVLRLSQRAPSSAKSGTSSTSVAVRSPEDALTRYTCAARSGIAAQLAARNSRSRSYNMRVWRMLYGRVDSRLPLSLDSVLFPDTVRRCTCRTEPSLIRGCSHHGCVLHVRYEHLGVHAGRILVPAEAVHHCLPRCRSGELRKW